MTFLERFLARLTFDADSDCWFWAGHINSTSPYGRFYWGETEERWVHRLVYRRFNGPIPEGYEVDHTCNTPTCVNPSHLEAVTADENRRRAVERRQLCHGAPQDGFVSACHRGCRCEPCRQYALDRAKRIRLRQREQGLSGKRPIPHGTLAGYTTYLCKCEACLSVGRGKAEQQRRQRGVKPFQPAQHGTTSMYTLHKCRCDDCRSCWSDYWKTYRAQKRQERAA